MMRWAFLFIGLLISAPAIAEPSAAEIERAKELYTNGRALFAEGDYENAMIAFEAAYAIDQQPLLLYNMASALERSGKLKEAVEKLNKYRAFAKTDERDQLERRIRNLEKRIEEQANEPGLDPALLDPDPDPVEVDPDPDPIPTKNP
ncbi:MAG: hypothetical protein HN348_04020, partial [Proteobacteria bacterium]|nr:hypothetical protein [Pseudomonadota bacterium]